MREGDREGGREGRNQKKKEGRKRLYDKRMEDCIGRRRGWGMGRGKTRKGQGSM